MQIEIKLDNNCTVCYDDIVTLKIKQNRLYISDVNDNLMIEPITDNIKVNIEFYNIS